MNLRSARSSFFMLKLFILLSLTLSLVDSAIAQNKPANLEMQKAEALKLVGENRYVDALPLLEKVAPAYPNDAEIWAQYGIAILANSSTLDSPAVRKKERIRGYEALVKAKKLGTENVRALYFLDQLSPDGGEEDNFSSDNPRVEKALREGEAFFGRGEYDKAFVAYERAYKINSKSYEAVLFMGDSLYAQKKYKESEVWFAKAAAIEPNREMAYRFWGDALLFQKKFPEARDKFVEAMIAEPFSRMTWDSLGRWVNEAGEKFAPLEIVPPGNNSAGDIKIDEKTLKAEDGTIHWRVYNETRKVQILEKARKNQRHTLAEEAAAWRKVADAVRKDIKAGKLKYPDQSLVNLTKIDDAGLLEAYLLMLRPHEDFGEDFFEYREKNRAKLRQFIVQFFLGMKN